LNVCRVHQSVFITLVVAVFIFVSGCSKNAAPLPDGFYRIDRGELNVLIEKAGIEGFSVWPQKIQKNSSGTSLKLGSLMSANKVILSCDGSIGTVAVPSSDSWIDENGELVAWWIRELGVTHYIGGYSETGRLLLRGMDPSGSYFWKYLGPRKSGVYSINEPVAPILSLENYHLHLFQNNDELHVLGNKSESIIDVNIFKISENELISIGEYEIKWSKGGSPAIFVVDYNIDTGNVVLVNSYDPPFKSKWYLYNNDQKEFKYLGKASDHGLFMGCDITEAVSNKLDSSQ